MLAICSFCPVIAVVALFCIAGTPVRAAEEKLTVSAAISLKDVLTEIANSATGSSRPAVRFNFGASGQLMAQIKQGAPVDIFISAAEKQVDELIDEGFADASTRRVIAGNTLVLIAPASATDGTLRDFEDLGGESIKRLALGQPRIVPAGDYAVEVLKSLRLDETLKHRIVYGAHVRQVLDYVERGEVSAGIVYNSDAAEAGEKVKVIASASEEWHHPIRYVAVIVSRSKHRREAEEFLAELLKPSRQKAFEKRGFAPATQPATQPASARKPPR